MFVHTYIGIDIVVVIDIYIDTLICIGMHMGIDRTTPHANTWTHT